MSTSLISSLPAKHRHTEHPESQLRRATTWLLDGGEVSGTELRQARLGTILQAAAPRCVAFPLDENGTLVTADAMNAQGRLLPEWMTAPIRDADKASGDSARAELRAARLEAVQVIYGVAALTGRPPAKALEDELGLSPRTAVHWIKQARDAGLLKGVRYAAARPARG
ncbi:hypothetical protein [Microbacterium sp.]|uniref:hypothetical protein n=1 Tax=Microbacterium sp. TaxID=51671 RepID=UPI003C78F539